MTKEFMGKGWKFPISINSSGKVGMSAYEDDIREAIWIILGTSKGERAMRPDFGCGIYDYVFAPINIATMTLMEGSVRESLVFWEPRIEITSVKLSVDENVDDKLLISIEYRVRTTNNRFNLVYPFYLKESR